MGRQSQPLGLPIASWVVEGACRYVIGLRFRRKSTRGTEAGARAVPHLRLDRLSRRQERGDHIHHVA